jgi:hypothetical protein
MYGGFTMNNTTTTDTVIILSGPFTGMEADVLFENSSQLGVWVDDGPLWVDRDDVLRSE